jgi:IMP dehydrogenase/GMP reductase
MQQAFYECAYKSFFSIPQDGGCTCPGDVSKAFGAGADFVMLGGMLAGHDESGGDLIEKNGKKMKQFYGMASQTAMKKYNASQDTEYRYVHLPSSFCADDSLFFTEHLRGRRSRFHIEDQSRSLSRTSWEECVPLALTLVPPS